VDFTEYSNQAVDYAALMARQFKAKILLMHVIEQFTYSVTDTIQLVDHYATLKTIAQPLIEGLQKKLRKAGVKADILVAKGIPAVEISEKALKDHFDLIILGTHGRTGIQRFMLGSVAERVVRTAPCPVLAVRGIEGRPAGRRKARRVLP
jgi:nucleotide-binding universal stress UspA family protein